MHKTISFVRHGQYEHHPGVFGGMLTEKGSEQAMRTAEEMIRRGATKVIASDYQRAIDTAGFIEMALEQGESFSDPILREMLPTKVPAFFVPTIVQRDAQDCLEEIEHRYLRADSQYDVVACHGNLIRALVTRALGAPLENWLRMSVMHGSVTTFSVSENLTRVIEVGACTHLPMRLRTA